MSNACHEPPSVWVFGHDALLIARFDWYKARNCKVGVQNQNERNTTFAKLKAALGHPYSEDIVLPDDFPPVRLALPEKGFSPDYFGYGGDEFCSRRLREAMNVPPEVVQFMPVDLVAGGAQVRAQEYHLMRVLAHQPVLDLEQSVYTLGGRSILHPERPARALWIDRYVLLEGLRPKTEIFRTDETHVTVFVTNALAKRVL